MHALWLGAQLPTDDAASSYAVVDDLAEKLRGRDVLVQIPAAESPLPVLENKRHELEAILFQLDEKEYADNQAGKLDEFWHGWKLFRAVALPNCQTEG